MKQLDRKQLRAVVGGAPNENAWPKNPNLTPVVCITEPCPPLFTPGSANGKK